MTSISGTRSALRSPRHSMNFFLHRPLNTWDDEGYEIRGYVYIIEFDSGWVKAGKTENPQQRLHTLAAHFYRNHDGVKINRMWLSIPVINPLKTERLVHECQRSCNSPG
ncbi:GIY-YIG nuclease family protein [Rhodococcus wratislaviensis]|uniref:GIY-YIG nuclease family protein n=1 Tax=Rhodococcus wratislaviensis TaxID=44752 RepID=UPI000F56103E